MQIKEAMIDSANESIASLKATLAAAKRDAASTARLHEKAESELCRRTADEGRRLEDLQ